MVRLLMVEGGSTGQGPALSEVLGRCRHSEPWVHYLLPHREGWRREVWIRETAHRDPVDVGVFVALPEHVAAAIRAEVKADLEAAIGVTLINLVVAFDPNSAFRISAAGMDDSLGAALTRSTMTHIHSLGFARGGYPKRAAMPDNEIGLGTRTTSKMPCSVAASKAH